MATAYYSPQRTNERADPPVPHETPELGKLRFQRFTFACPADVVDESESDTIEFVKMPAGRVRIFGNESKIDHSGNSSSTINIGIGAYVSVDGTVVALDVDALAAAMDIGSAGVSALVITHASVESDNSVLIDSQDGFIIYATLDGADLVEADTISGMIVYSLD